MKPSEIFDRLGSQEFASRILKTDEAGLQPWIQIDPLWIEDILYFLRDEKDLAFDSLACLSGVDYGAGKELGVVYHLTSMTHKHWLVVKVMLPRENPVVPTIEHVYKAANWHEREAFDLYGIRFEFHPDLRRILLPDDWEGHPLRKDYQVQEYYHGIRVPF